MTAVTRCRPVFPGLAPTRAFRHVQQKRWESDRTRRAASTKVLQVDQATFHPFGQDKSALYAEPLTWHLNIDSSTVWAVVGSGSSTFLSSVLLGRARADPPLSRSWPFLKDPANEHLLLHDIITKVAFKTRLKGFGTPSQIGEFSDYTARFGALQEEDQVTLHQHFEEYLKEHELPKDETRIRDVAERLQITSLLDRPLIGLSNGQTRRARIARALLKQPRILILEEPFTGLDPPSRQLICSNLLDLHKKSAPNLVLTLRLQDGLPDFVTHVVHLADLPNGQRSIQYVGPKEQWPGPPASFRSETPKPPRARPHDAKELIRMDDINISIRGTPVLSDLSWTVKQGDRWLLKGPNGSGKSTLLSLITGDHPQSYVQPLQVFGQDRGDIATASLQARMGQVSPEIFNAFPRKATPGAMNGTDAVVTGFENVFVYRKATQEQSDRVASLMDYFEVSESIRKGFFAEADAAHQALLLFLRAVVKGTDLMILDEPFSGMTERMVARCKQFIDEELRPEQALILVTHYPEDETPSSVDSLFEIDAGRVMKSERR